MKKLFLLISLLVVVFSALSEEIGKPRFIINTPGGYLREVIPFEIEIPGATEQHNLDIQLKVLEGEGDIVTSTLAYSVSFDTETATAEAWTTNAIGFIPLSVGKIKLKALVKDIDASGPELKSNELILNIVPRPSFFKEHIPFLHTRLNKERYYAGQEILLSFELFFSDMVQETFEFEPDFAELPVSFIEQIPAKNKTIYYSQEATTIRSLIGAVVVGESPGILTIPPQHLSLTYTKNGNTIEDKLSTESMKIEILELPNFQGKAAKKNFFIGENLRVQLLGVPPSLQFQEPYSFEIMLEGEANLQNISSLRPFLNIPDFVTETLVKSNRVLQKGKLVSSLLFRYEETGMSFFQPRRIRFESPFFSTKEEKWEMIKEESAVIKRNYSFLAIFLILIPVVIVHIFAMANPSFANWILSKFNFTDRRFQKKPLNNHDKEMGFDKFVKKYGLTSREQEITMLILNGKPTTTMADELFISPETVKKHIKNILKKTETHSRYELSALATKYINNEKDL